MNQQPIGWPRIGIVVVSYNTCALLRQCLTSIEEQHVPVHVVVIDNASIDHSAAMVAREFPRVTLIRNSTNRGFAAATNQGLEVVRLSSDFILLLNPDAKLCPGAIEEMLAFLQVHPRVGVAGARLLYPDGRPQEGAFRFPTLLMAFFDLFPPRGPLLGRLQNSFLNGRYPEERGATPFPIDHPLGAAMMIRRTTLDDVGLFDEDYWLYAEEVDWCLRCRQAGWAIWQVPSARVVHVASASASQFRVRSFVALHRSRLRFVDKWWSRAQRGRYRALIRAGMAWVMLHAWTKWLRGELALDDLRSRLYGYASVGYLAGNTSSYQTSGLRDP